MKRKIMLGVAAAIVGMPYFACAAPDDPVRGRALAVERCARCHNIDKGARRVTTAPTFAEIARRLNFNASQLAIYMTFSHIPMGDGRIAPGDAGDLAAYIVTLRRR